jgi:hypothetical protein
MNDEARLQAYLDEHPGDTDSRRILADLLEEWGHDEAAYCQRWLAERSLWPDHDLEPFQLSGWHWWSRADRPFHKRRAHAVLPNDVQRFMPEGEWLYDTRREAENVLAEALARFCHAAEKPWLPCRPLS